jgi:hypothetical protein
MSHQWYNKSQAGLVEKIVATENQENWDELEKKRLEQQKKKRRPPYKNGSDPFTEPLKPENPVDEFQQDNKKKQESE